jgi:CheY-like chemotaxis protein
MDGYTATRQIKGDPELRSIPIIAVTSYALSGEEKKARARGGLRSKTFQPTAATGALGLANPPDIVAAGRAFLFASLSECAVVVRHHIKTGHS